LQDEEDDEEEEEAEEVKEKVSLSLKYFYCCFSPETIERRLVIAAALLFAFFGLGEAHKESQRADEYLNASSSSAALCMRNSLPWFNNR